MSEERIEQLERSVRRIWVGLVVMALGLVVAAPGVAWDLFGPRAADTCGECREQCIDRDAKRALENGNGSTWSRRDARAACFRYCRTAAACVKEREEEERKSEERKRKSEEREARRPEEARTFLREHPGWCEEYGRNKHQWWRAVHWIEDPEEREERIALMKSNIAVCLEPEFAEQEE